MPSTVGIVASGYHWTPLALTPALWLDAADPATITASGGAVSQWADKSVHGRHVAQNVAANQPTTGAATWNGRNVLEFAGDYLTAATASDWTFMHDGTVWTLLIVVKAQPPAEALLMGVLGTNRLTQNNVGASLYHDDRVSFDNSFGAMVSTGGGSAELSVLSRPSGTLLPGTVTLARHEFLPADPTAAARHAVWSNGIGPVRVNTSTFAPITTLPARALDVGAGGGGVLPFTGQIAEIIIVPRGLTADETTAAEAHLTAKWGL